jgi:glutathionyl-hydroquinone reductase
MSLVSSSPQQTFQHLILSSGKHLFSSSDCRHDIISVLRSRINHIFVRDLPNVMRWIKDIVNLPGIRNVVNVEHIKGMSFTKKAFNSNGIIPLGNGFTLP